MGRFRGCLGLVTASEQVSFEDGDFGAFGGSDLVYAAGDYLMLTSYPSGSDHAG